MKRRFLITIGLVLLIAIGSVGILQYVLFRSEQFRLIDSRIESTATLLITSELSKTDLRDFEEAESIISDVVGGEAFNQFIIVYKRTGEELYRSPSAEVLPEHIPKDEKWQTIETEAGHIIRVLTLPLDRGLKPGKVSRDTRILQTGLILDQDLLRMKTLSRNVLIYSFVILALILMTTFWLAEVLLQPLKGLAFYLRHLSSHIDTRDLNASGPGQEKSADPWLPSALKTGNDEFGQLVREAKNLRDRIGHGLHNTQVWTAQMAHEMKTPLTILQNSLERARMEESASARESQLNEATAEIAHLNSLISSFLEWSTTENAPEGTDELHAVRLGQVAHDLVEKFVRQNANRVSLAGDSQLRVFAKRGFAQQAISNLVTNALKYSPTESPVQISVSENQIVIQDFGPGLPDQVYNHIGEPFNYGPTDSHGFGLGLAWVQTICSRYGWKLRFERKKEGESTYTLASITFPVDDTEII